MEKRILVIDDEHGFCEMMKGLLTSEGFDVDYAAHPIVATERAMPGDYDLITLDLNLDEIHGADVWSLYRERVWMQTVLMRRSVPLLVVN